jgi:hypothetical protein
MNLYMSPGHAPVDDRLLDHLRNRLRFAKGLHGDSRQRRNLLHVLVT